VVGDLDPYTTYEFTVETKGNPALWSQAIKCQTKESGESHFTHQHIVVTMGFRGKNTNSAART